MNKLDLIIDALESAHHTNDTSIMGLTKLRHTVALDAARELKELNPVAWIGRRTTSEGDVLDGFLTCDSDEYGAIPVYILD